MEVTMSVVREEMLLRCFSCDLAVGVFSLLSRTAVERTPPPGEGLAGSPNDPELAAAAVKSRQPVASRLTNWPTNPPRPISKVQRSNRPRIQAVARWNRNPRILWRSALRLRTGCQIPSFRLSAVIDIVDRNVTPVLPNCSATTAECASYCREVELSK